MGDGNVSFSLDHVIQQTLGYMEDDDLHEIAKALREMADKLTKP